MLLVLKPTGDVILYIYRGVRALGGEYYVVQVG